MRAVSKLFVAIGMILIVSAFALTGYNFWDIDRAEKSASSVLTVLAAEVPDYVSIGDENASVAAAAEEYSDELDAPVVEYADTQDDDIPLYVLNPQIAMPIATVDGFDYIGILTVPSLKLELPIMSDWDYDKLKVTACRYSGSVYTNDMVIAGHNYRSHFGGLKNLSIGDEVRFTDSEGNVFLYEVAELEVLEPTAIEEMTCGDDWDMTLFTCTISGQTRIAIRLVRADME